MILFLAVYENGGVKRVTMGSTCMSMFGYSTCVVFLLLAFTSVHCQLQEERKKFVCPPNSSTSHYCPQPGDPPDNTHCISKGCGDGRGEHHCGNNYNKDFYCPRPDQTVFDTICCKDANGEDACCSAEGLAEWAIIVIAVVCVLVFLLCVCCICCCCCACCPCHHTRRSEYVIFRNT